MEGLIKFYKGKKWKEGYGKIEGKAFVIYESAMGGDPLAGPLPLGGAIVKRGMLEGDVAVPKGEDNCQLAFEAGGERVQLSAPSFLAASEWLSALKAGNAAVAEAKKTQQEEEHQGGGGGGQQGKEEGEGGVDGVLVQLVAVAGRGGGSEVVRGARPLQTLVMAELKRCKTHVGAADSPARRQLEAGVAEVAGLLREFLGAVKQYAESEEKSDRERLEQLAASLRVSYKEMLAREAKVVSGANSPAAAPPAVPEKRSPRPSSSPPSSSSSTATTRSSKGSSAVSLSAAAGGGGGGGAGGAGARSELEEACEEMLRAQREGAKAAVAAAGPVKQSCLTMLRQAKAFGEEQGGSVGSLIEDEVATGASLLKEMVAAVRAYTQEEEEPRRREVERLAKALQEVGRKLREATTVAAPQKSPRMGSSLTMDQLMNLGKEEPEKPANKGGPRGSVEDSIDAVEGFVKQRAASPRRTLNGSSSSSSLPVVPPAAAVPTPAPKPVAAARPGKTSQVNRRSIPSLQDPAHRLLLNAVEDAVYELRTWIESPEGGGADGPLKDDVPETEERSVRVRGALCSALASIFAYRYKVSKGWLGSLGWPSQQQHFWYFISDFANNASVSSVAGLPLQQCLRLLIQDDKAGWDENAKFRSFVVVGLNRKKLTLWLHELLENFQSVEKFYETGALFHDLEAKQALIAILAPIEEYEWDLNVHFEWIIKNRKKLNSSQ